VTKVRVATCESGWPRNGPADRASNLTPLRWEEGRERFTVTGTLEKINETEGGAGGDVRAEVARCAEFRRRASKAEEPT